ncbi:hypothetical protein BABINDRAFT_40969 [Babjeviella inositovora NRRL Y-12698]|uniref:peptidylprolyl isomerase n=1 Tax=Babjeviella inositovora NRRL Y-12698 TaxID=984486 RepID=A0A1E3QKV5_9ASCO|nr:uncharacterized protein BABINDRAFT_40969 [Babjeviella inositovora NRRL Y-12698]ODQ77627.1 hypothetical protein BABINDRAFT_40969 [Babjeviella inositovora NRRL Y-12698]
MSLKLEEIHPKVFLDIQIGDLPLGRVVIELFEQLAPNTVANFQHICRGDHTSLVSGGPLTYKNTYFHRVIKNFMCQGGDVNLADLREVTTQEQYLENKYAGMGGESVFRSGENFESENLTQAIDRSFLVAMANDGDVNHNKSQFFITTYPAPHLTGKHTVFGQVCHGKSVVRDMERVRTFQTNLPNWEERVVITDCGDWREGDALPVYNCSNLTLAGDIYEEYPDDDETINPDSSESVYQAAEIIKEAGTQLFKQKQTQQAFFKYKKALRYVNEFIPGEDQPEWNAKYLVMKKKLYLNLSLVCTQLQDYQTAYDYATLLIELNHEYPAILTTTPAELAKAYFRGGAAQVKLGKVEDAVKSLRKANELLPGDALIEREYQNAEALVTNKKNKEKQKYAKFFA